MRDYLINYLLSRWRVKMCVGDRIFPLSIPQGYSPPAIVVQKISEPRVLGLRKCLAKNHRFQISAYHTQLVKASTIMRAVSKEIDYLRLPPKRGQKVVIHKSDGREDYDYDTDTYRVDIDIFMSISMKE